MKPIAESLTTSDRGVWSTVVVATIILVVVILIRPAFIFATYYVSRSRQARRKRARERLEARSRTRRLGRAGAGPGRPCRPSSWRSPR